MRNTATGPGSITEDGCAVDIYRRLAAAGEPEIIHGAIPPGATILELGAGAGRITHPLIELGHRVTAVDSSAEMLAEISGAEKVHAKIEDLELARTFDAVILGSCLINTPHSAERAALLATCRRHVSDSGVVLIERYIPYNLQNAKDGLLEDRDGIRCSLVNVVVDGNRFSATIVYETVEATWTQSFLAIILAQDVLADELSRSALRFCQWLDDRQSWLSAMAVMS